MASGFLPLLLTAVTVSTASAQPVRLAAPGFSGVNFDEAIAGFYSEHFAQQLALRKLSVVTAAEITALIGLERQKQLLGCQEDASSCLTELSNALGVDGIITGSIGKVGRTLQANIKIIRATDGSTLSLISRTARSEDALFEALTEASGIAASDVLEKLRPGTHAALDAERAGLGPAAYRVRRANVVQADLFALSFGVFAVEYERVLIPLISVTVRPAVLRTYLKAEPTSPTYLGGELGVGARLYPVGRSPHGFWLGAESRANVLREDLSGAVTLNVAAAGALGWNWVHEEFPIAASVAVALGGYFVGQGPVGLGVDVRMTASVGVPF